ncbi:BREX protein BrxB domain-containing protein [Kribbella sp. VKM Ac-2566]|uniref:BREX protein BrxB domain-containing protein n=1 Tax=Kribbella sp. VKM Ac-2566 TaxID=2512218 RepID=UPI001064137C|nr:BREX protein BrxB domain-containing protein [Kribbella sp. VKM Ac-2566]TDW98260.1 uncharacterized protein DUF1788 [Kribbella sp. VKM Ac-2566]
MPLPEPLQQIADDILSFLRDSTQSSPYAIYVYEPDKEFAVRAEMQDLSAYLNAKRVDVATISLADLFWKAVDDSNFYETIVDAEVSMPNNHDVLDDVHKSLREILNTSPTLAGRVLAELDTKPDNCAVILHRAGALYPVFRTSALLDDLRERLRRPVLLLYPGHVVDPYGLSFMSKCEPTHGYRAKIYQRSML